jgi:hypothetical protein
MISTLSCVVLLTATIADQSADRVCVCSFIAEVFVSNTIEEFGIHSRRGGER